MTAGEISVIADIWLVTIDPHSLCHVFTYTLVNRTKVMFYYCFIRARQAQSNPVIKLKPLHINCRYSPLLCKGALPALQHAGLRKPLTLRLKALDILELWESLRLLCPIISEKQPCQDLIKWMIWIWHYKLTLLITKEVLKCVSADRAKHLH